MMLDAGAETDVVNSVGRTAAQMAAFVGASGCDICSFTQRSLVFLSLVSSKRRDHKPLLCQEHFDPSQHYQIDAFTFIGPIGEKTTIYTHSIRNIMR